jgi:hypothetical protein
MEVHHHSHPAPLSRERSDSGGGTRKKWTHYFWEFLMLFLAVFCGFLAENQREHMIEHKREKDYIKLLSSDLQTDTAIINDQLPRISQAVSGLDTLIKETYAFLEGKADTRMMYYTYHRYCRNSFIVVLSQRTLNQLKNSGNMRLIRNNEALEIILNSEVGFQHFDEKTRIVTQLKENTSEFGTRIFDFREYQKANTNADGSTNQQEDGFLKLNYQPALNTSNPEYIKEFIGRVGYYRNTLNSYRLDIQKAFHFLLEAITNLKRNYRL